MQTLLIVISILLLAILGCLVYLIVVCNEISGKLNSVKLDMAEYFYCQYRYLKKWILGEEESEDSKDQGNA